MTRKVDLCFFFNECKRLKKYTKQLFESTFRVNIERIYFTYMRERKQEIFARVFFSILCRKKF